MKINKNKKKIVFFSPFGALWEHTYIEGILSRYLNKDFDVFFVLCDGLLGSFCTSMRAMRLDYDSSQKEKKEICNLCQKNRKKFKNTFHANFISIDSFHTSNNQEKIDTILQKEIDPWSFQLEGHYIARRSLYDFLLRYKKSNLNFSPKEQRHFLNDFSNALKIFYASKKLLETLTPDIVLMTNTLYGAHSVFFSLTKSMNIPCYTLHAGINLSDRLAHLIIGKNSTLDFLLNRNTFWEKYSKIPLIQSDYIRILSHFKLLSGGKSFLAYSSNFSEKEVPIQERYNIQENQKILLAVLSSYDEQLSKACFYDDPQNLDLLFPKQSDWIDSLINYVKDRKELFLIIRVHPREFPNKREGQLSDHAKELKKILSNLPNNIIVNWPNEEISLYSLAFESDLILTSWSSVGREMTLFGLPVLTYATQKACFYPPEIHHQSSNKKEFFKILEQSLSADFDFDRLIKAFRWYNFEMNHSLISIKEVFMAPEVYERTFAEKIYHRIIKISLKFMKRPLTYNYKIENNFSPKCQKVGKMLKNDQDNILHIVSPPIVSLNQTQNQDLTKKYYAILLKMFQQYHNPKSKLWLKVQHLYTNKEIWNKKQKNPSSIQKPVTQEIHPY